MPQPSLCSITECGQVKIARGWCRKHYNRWKRHGDPTARGGKFYGTTEDRFWHYVSKQPDGHWMWTGPVNSTEAGRDYGLLFDSEKGRNVLAHRYSFELHKGPIDHEPDHTCRVVRCVAPDHLEDVTHKTNVLRGESPAAKHAQQTVCDQGHELEIIGGKRACRVCRNATARRWYAENRGTGTGTGGTHRARTRCPQGHAYDLENTYYNPKTGGRDCRKCRRRRNAESRQRTKTL